MNRNCKNCLHGDVCPANTVCEYFAPLADNGNMDEYIENERRQFYKEWFRYTSEDDV